MHRKPPRYYLLVVQVDSGSFNVSLLTIASRHLDQTLNYFKFRGFIIIAFEALLKLGAATILNNGSLDHRIYLPKYTKELGPQMLG